MRYNKDWGKPGKSPEKRKSEHPAADPLKRGPFKLTPAFVKFVESKVFNRKTPRSKPKSMYRHGLRVLFADCDQYLVVEIAKLAQETFTKHTAAHSRIDKGYFDFAFATAADADKAAEMPLKINERYVPTVRTRYAKDTNLFIGFDELPDTINRKFMISLLSEGLKSYGEVIEVELNKDPLFPTSSSSRGYAIIKPLPNINENIGLIPRVAHFSDGTHTSPSFKVLPERAPPVCSQCQHLGHNQNACPENLIKMLKTKSEAETLDEPMEEVNGDDLLDDTNSEAALDSFNITESYNWGDLAEYKYVEPTTKEQRREAHLAAQALKESHLETSTPAPPQNPANAPNNPIPATTTTDDTFVQTVNPFGEQVCPIANAPRKRGRPRGTTKGNNVDNTPRNPVGRPRKDTQPCQPEQASTDQDFTHQTPIASSSPHEDHERILANHQHISQPVFYEPSVPKAHQDSEEHSHTGVPSQY